MWFQENIHTPPHRRDWKFRGGGGGRGVLKGQKFKAMYEANWNFRRGGVIGQIPSIGGGGGYGYFLEPHNKSSEPVKMCHKILKSIPKIFGMTYIKCSLGETYTKQSGQ